MANRLVSVDSVSQQFPTDVREQLAVEFVRRGDLVHDVRDYGAVGDGVTNDTSAIGVAQAAAAAAGAELFFPRGSYATSGVSMTVPWHMAEDAIILYTGAQQGTVITCAASGLRSGDVHIDFAGTAPSRGLYISGSGNEFGVVSVANAVSGTDPAWLVRGIYLSGNENTIREARFIDFVNDGHDNDSMPQSLCLASTATRNSVTAVHGNNVRTGVVDASTGANSIGQIVTVNAEDNALYVVAGAHCSVGSIMHEGPNSACGFRSGANATIGSIFVTGHPTPTGSAVFFGDCGDVTIGEIVVTDLREAILHLNLADTGHINIGSIKGTVINSGPFAFARNLGTVQYLTIDRVDVNVTLMTGWTGSTRSLIRLDAANGLNLGTFKVDVVFDGFTTVDPFYVRIHNALTRRSFIDALRVSFFESDGFTPRAVTFTANGYTGASDVAIVQANLDITEGCLDASNSLRSCQYAAWHPGRLVRVGAPAAGAWRKGAVIWAESPAAGTVGYICTVAGTPGTWVTFG